jgi:hypothetical protein
MCFYFPCFDTFFKKEDIVGDDDGSTSSMPDLHESHFSARMIGVNISPGQDPHSFDTLVYTDGGGGDDVVVDLLSCDDGDDDDDDGDEEGGFVFNKPRPWNSPVAVLYPNIFRDPLSYFDPDVLRVSKKAMQQQVNQKKVELRNLGMEVPDDQTIFVGLDVSSSFRLINEALEKDPATSKKNQHRN